MSNHPSERPASVFVVLACAILAVSSAAVLVRAIDGVNPVVIAFWRMAGSALVLLPALRRFAPRDGGRMLLSGALLAVHFATWFASLEHIAVMRSTLLVTLAPIWAGLIELGILGRWASLGAYRIKENAGGNEASAFYLRWEYYKASPIFGSIRINDNICCGMKYLF